MGHPGEGVVKNNRILPAALACGLVFASWAYSCPQFIEFFPDPKDVSDQEGEYVEIRLDEFRAESLFVQFESKTVLAFAWPDKERFVLVHDVLRCSNGEFSENAACGSLGKVSLPNSRESAWKLWAGSCMDSVNLPRPKSGKVIRRVGTSDEWTNVDEKSVSKNSEPDSLLLAGFWKDGRSLLRVTEVHHCPEEPMPEWVEIYNASGISLPLEAFHFCDRGGSLGKVGDSIRPYQTMLVSKDTASLRAALGIPDVRLAHVALGFLNNVEGSLRLCYGNEVVDSVYWNKGTVACPAGFNPLTGRRDFTPGYQQKSAVGGALSGSTKVSSRIHTVNPAPFSYKLSSRVVSKKGAAFRVRIESEYEVVLSLLDSAGRHVWKTVASAMSNEWLKIPVQEYLGIGVGFISLSVGDYEDVVGILVRP